jgi:hypothetical protein
MIKRSGASEAELERLRQYVGADLPADSLGFLRWSNGAHGVMGTTRPLIADLGGMGPIGRLYGAEEAIEHTEYWKRPTGYLHIGDFNDASLRILLDTRSGDTGSMMFAMADVYWDEAVDEDREEEQPYRAASLYDLLDRLAAENTHLVGADLRGTSLRGADLSNLNLWSTNLAGADLTGADLRDSCLIGTDLTEANLKDAQLGDAYFNQDTRWPDGFDPLRHGAEFVKAET